MSDFPPHFSLEELTRSQTAARNNVDNSPNEEQMSNLIRLAWWLESLRDRIRLEYPGAYIIVSSGLRVQLLNQLIGGSKTSAHMEGLAADIHCNKLEPLELALFIAKNMADDGFDQIIHEFGQWVHIGLSEALPRYEELTAMRINGKTKYYSGLIEVKDA